MKTFFLTLALLGITVYTNVSLAQKITGFKLTKIIEEEHGWTQLEIRPLDYDGYAPKDELSIGLYGLIVCYTINGDTRVIKKDITSHIQKDGVYTFTMSYSKGSKVTIQSWETFYLPSDKGPDKSTYCDGKINYE